MANLDLASFDLSLVQRAIRAQPLPEHEYLGVESRLQTALRCWLPSDLANYDSCLLEEEFQNEGHGFLDLVLVRGPRCVIVDWKTAAGWDSPGWVLKKKLDPQTSWYLGYGADHLRAKGLEVLYLEYRCLDPEGSQKCFQIAASPLHVERCRSQAKAVRAAFQGLTTLTGPWPQNLPQACFIGSKSGSPTCPFYQNCVTGSEPRLVASQDAAKLRDWLPRSKSAYKMFLDCPERYRRTRLLGDSTDDRGIEAKIGVAFHAGAVELWRQAFLAKSK